MSGVLDQPRTAGLGRSAAFGLWLALFLLYTANGRSIGGGDVVPATLLPVALLRGDGPFLDRYAEILRAEDGRLPGYATESRGRAVSRYPLGPAIVAAPFVLPQLLLLDAEHPSWESDGQAALDACRRIGKNAAAAIASLAAVLMATLLVRLGLGRAAVPAAVIVALGSDHWSMASQALWQHGPASLCLTGALLLLRTPDGTPGPPRSSARLASAGALTAMMVVCRPIDAVFAATISLWSLANLDRRGRWAFHLPAFAIAGALVTYNVAFFDTPYGGYADLEETHPWAHGTRGTWTGSLPIGAAGTLVSPSHGLLVYCPWVALALVVLPRTVPGRLPRSAPERWLLWSLVPTFFLLSKYSCWWGGHCYGPRFWIDAGPIFAVALGLAIAAGGRWVRRALVPASAWAIAVQAVAFLCYPSTWHGRPVNADRHHERLWDWRDTELTRGLAEGIHPPDRGSAPR